jgi:phage portal protein BeeE
LFRTRDRPQNRLSSGFSFLFGGTASGKTVNERTAMQTTAVYACVRILAEAIAGLPMAARKKLWGTSCTTSSITNQTRR